MSDTPARVVFTTGFSRRYTGGVTEFAIQAKNLRGVLKAMDALFPGLGDTLEEETTVAIDGEIHDGAAVTDAINRQAQIIAYNDDYRMMIVATLAPLLLLPLMHRGRRPSGPATAAHVAMD